MSDDSVIGIGDRVELTRENDNVYKTKIEDMYGGGSYLVSVPSYGRVPMVLRPNDKILLAFYRESGRYIAPVRVIDVGNKDGIRYALLLMRSEPRRDQRREAFRVPVRLKVLIFEDPEETPADPEEAPASPAKAPEDPEEASAGRDATPANPEETPVRPDETAGSRDISLTGIALTTRKAYPSGKHYLLEFNLNDQRGAPPLIISARVVRSVPGFDRNTYDIGMHFHGQTNSVSVRLSRYMFTQQQKQLRLKRLVETEQA